MDSLKIMVIRIPPPTFKTQSHTSGLLLALKTKKQAPWTIITSYGKQHPKTDHIPNSILTSKGGALGIFTSNLEVKNRIETKITLTK